MNKKYPSYSRKVLKPEDYSLIVGKYSHSNILHNDNVVITAFNRIKESDIIALYEFGKTIYYDQFPSINPELDGLVARSKRVIGSYMYNYGLFTKTDLIKYITTKGGLSEIRLMNGVGSDTYDNIFNWLGIAGNPCIDVGFDYDRKKIVVQHPSPHSYLSINDAQNLIRELEKMINVATHKSIS